MTKYQHRPPAQSRRNIKKESEMNGNGRLIQPNSVNVSTTYVDGPLANPSSLAMQGPGGAQILVMGGLTKVEQLAGEIAGGWIAQSNFLHVALQKLGGVEALNQSAVEDAVCEHSVNLAEKILAECARRRTPEQTE